MLEQTAPAAMGSPAPVLPPATQAGPAQPAPAETQAAAIGQAVQPAPASVTNGQPIAQPVPNQPPAEQAPGQPAAKPGQSQPRPAYVPAVAIPTQEGPHGARYDFNDGCRVALSEPGKAWRGRYPDLHYGKIPLR